MSNQQTYKQALEGIESRDSVLAQELESLRSAGADAAGAEALTGALDGTGEDMLGLDKAAYEYGRVARPILSRPEPPPPATSLSATPRSATSLSAALQPETPEPAVIVDHGHLRKLPATPQGKTWQERLDQANGALLKAIDAVGRIEVKGNGDLTVAGTGFLIRSDVIATNRHVAEQFAEAGEGGFVFKLNLGNEEMEASIDFLEEVGSDASLEFEIVRVLPMDMDVTTDMAFLEVKSTGTGGETLTQPLEFHTGTLEPGDFVAAIGYPQRDTRVKHAKEQEEIFGNVFDKKRVSPGEIRRIEQGVVIHDCSVLRGNSGSPLIHLESGKVVGIHSTGEFLEENIAVSVRAAAAVLDSVEAKRAEERRLSTGWNAADTPAAATRSAALSGERMIPSVHWTRARPRTWPHAGRGPSQ